MKSYHGFERVFGTVALSNTVDAIKCTDNVDDTKYPAMRFRTQQESQRMSTSVWQLAARQLC